jgi:hypothetical protein
MSTTATAKRKKAYRPSKKKKAYRPSKNIVSKAVDVLVHQAIDLAICKAADKAVDAKVQTAIDKAVKKIIAEFDFAEAFDTALGEIDSGRITNETIDRFDYDRATSLAITGLLINAR